MRYLVALLLVPFLLVGCVAQPAVNGGAPAEAAATAPASADATTEATAVPDAAASDLPVVRVGHVPVTIYAPLYIAVEKGYFEDAGMQVELLPVEGGTENVVQVAAGNFDVAGGGIGAGMLNAVARGIEFEIVAPLHTERPPLTSPLVVSKSAL